MIIKNPKSWYPKIDFRMDQNRSAALIFVPESYWELFRTVDMVPDAVFGRGCIGGARIRPLKADGSPNIQPKSRYSDLATFGKFRVFGEAFAAPTGGTQGVARCHLQRLGMRYDKKTKMKKIQKHQFFDDFFFSRNFL